MNDRKLVLKQLDRILQEWRAVCSKYAAPRVGWVRTTRKALGMTTHQLAKRLGLARARIKQIESAEPKGAVTLHALQEVAAAMDCELVYAIVPKTSLEKILEERAKLIAAGFM
jgi:predicted DNA-binding mobile mystery protein A